MKCSCTARGSRQRTVYHYHLTHYTVSYSLTLQIFGPTHTLVHHSPLILSPWNCLLSLVAKWSIQYAVLDAAPHSLHTLVQHCHPVLSSMTSHASRLAHCPRLHHPCRPPLTPPLPTWSVWVAIPFPSRSYSGNWTLAAGLSKNGRLPWVPHWARSCDANNIYVCDAGNFPFNTADSISEPCRARIHRSMSL
jgi:hypothetical protein